MSGSFENIYSSFLSSIESGMKITSLNHIRRGFLLDKILVKFYIEESPLSPEDFSRIECLHFLISLSDVEIFPLLRDGRIEKYECKSLSGKDFYILVRYRSSSKIDIIMNSSVKSNLDFLIRKRAMLSEKRIFEKLNEIDVSIRKSEDEIYCGRFRNLPPFEKLNI